MKRALLILSPSERVAFSARAATEGDHQTLDCIPGAALWGWAASRCYGTMKDPFLVFHSGAVRFTNAVPLTLDGRPAYPAPQILQKPKHGKKGTNQADAREWLDMSLVRVAGAKREQGDNVQYEAMRGFYVAGAVDKIAVIRPSIGRRLKTATKGNRAETGKLFGYGHIEPNEDAIGAPQRFAAIIEAEPGVDSEDWTALLHVFGHAQLQLGRSRQVEYGGRFACNCRELNEDDCCDLWRENVEIRSDKALVIWALSALVVLDSRTGQATAGPRLQDLFPNKGLSGALDMKKSVIVQRRYAPWNGKLGCRDSERAVIDAGSVLWFENVDIDPAGLPAVVGQYTEAGLGRLWINAPLLAGDGPQPWSTSIVVPHRNEAVSGTAMVSNADRSPEAAQLLTWMRERLAERDPAAREKWLDGWEKDMVTLFKSARQFADGPSRSQWNAVGEAIRAAHNQDALARALFEGGTPVCGRPTQATEIVAWGAEGRLGNRTISFRDWLKQEIERGSDAGNGGLPWPQLKLALYGLIKKAAAEAAKSANRA